MPDNKSDNMLSREEIIKRVEAKRKRKRKRLDHVLSVQTMTILYFVVLLIALLLIVIPRSKVSQIEKRDLARFPKPTIKTLASGQFGRDLQNYYDDTIPKRDSFKNANNSMKNKFGLRSSSNVEIVGNVNTASDPDEDKDKKTQKDYKKEEAEGAFNNGFVIVRQNDHWRGMPLFAGGSCDDYVSIMTDLKEAVGDDVAVYAMPIPLASQFYLPSNFSEYSADQGKTIDDIFDRLPKGIKEVKLVDALGDHQDEDIYLRTDHHWTQLGAFYAAKAFAKTADVDFPKLKSFAKIEREGYVGSLYGYTQSANIQNDPETFILLIPSAKYTNSYHEKSYAYISDKDLFLKTDLANSYLAFLGSDTTPTHVKTEVDNGRKLLIIKDSYGNPLPSLLTSSFEDIYTVDLRFCTFNLPDFVEEKGVTDIVTAFSIDTAAHPDDNFRAMLTQNAGSSIPEDEPETKEPAVSPSYKPAKRGEDPLLVEN